MTITEPAIPKLLNIDYIQLLKLTPNRTLSLRTREIFNQNLRFGIPHNKLPWNISIFTSRTLAFSLSPLKFVLFYFSQTLQQLSIVSTQCGGKSEIFADNILAIWGKQISKVSDRYEFYRIIFCLEVCWSNFDFDEFCLIYWLV